MSTWGPSPCDAPNEICVLDTISQLSQCCAPGQKCTAGGCTKKGAPAPKPCSAEPGTVACKKPDGSYNCCGKGSSCIPRGPYKGQCATDFYSVPGTGCLKQNNPVGYVCVTDPIYKAASYATSRQECTADGPMDLDFTWPFHPCPLDGSTICNGDGSGTAAPGSHPKYCCGPYHECDPEREHPGTCVFRQGSQPLVTCEAGLQQCGKGGLCCDKEAISGEPQQCANAEMGICCAVAQNEVNGRCCPDTQLNGRGICCPSGTVAWGQSCLDKGGNPV